MPLVPSILPSLDTIRTIGGRLGLRVYTVTVRVRTWSGSRPGLGTPIDTDTVLVNTGTDGVTSPVQVRQLSRADVFASGGRYQSGDWKVGPMTPSYAAQFFGPAGGYTGPQLDPNVPSTPTTIETFWLLNGPGQPVNAILEKVGEEASSMHYTIVARQTGKQL